MTDIYQLKSNKGKAEYYYLDKNIKFTLTKPL